MKPRIKLATAQTPDGGEIMLFQHDRDFTIIVNGEDLMHSRRHQSELELARLGCTNLTLHPNPKVLIGGLGMGYTVRQTLDLLNPKAKIVVGELMPAVIEWNHEFLGILNNNPLQDPRVELRQGDIVDLINSSKDKFEAILLDIDNGPEAMSHSANSRLYGYQGIMACQQALSKKGCLAIWSAKPDKDFEQILMGCGFHVSRFRVPAHKGKTPPSHFVWVASMDKNLLPPGGGKPREKKGRGKSRRR